MPVTVPRSIDPGPGRGCRAVQRHWQCRTGTDAGGLGPGAVLAPVQGHCQYTALALRVPQHSHGHGHPARCHCWQSAAAGAVNPSPATTEGTHLSGDSLRVRILLLLLPFLLLDLIVPEATVS